MPPITRHRIWTQYGPIDTGFFKATFYGPGIQGDWGWFQASKLVKNHEEAMAAFRAWAADTEAYINENFG